MVIWNQLHVPGQALGTRREKCSKVLLKITQIETWILRLLQPVSWLLLWLVEMLKPIRLGRYIPPCVDQKENSSERSLRYQLLQHIWIDYWSWALPSVTEWQKSLFNRIWPSVSRRGRFFRTFPTPLYTNWLLKHYNSQFLTSICRAGRKKKTPKSPGIHVKFNEPKNFFLWVQFQWFFFVRSTHLGTV